MNNNKNIKLVIADIDGTMVTDSRVLTKRTKRVINMLHDRGIKIGIASGRDYHQLLNDVEYWGFQFPFDIVIGMNGGQLYTGHDKMLREYDLLQPDAIKSIIEMMEPLDLNPFIYGQNNTMICKRVDPATKASEERNSMSLHVVKNVAEFWQRPVNKIMFRTTERQMPEVKQWADLHNDPRYIAFKTQTTMLEFTDPKVSKGKALARYAELSGIPLADMMSFGDMTNDNEMLKQAGWGVCMKNGSSDTKASAAYITEDTNNEDGMARYLIKYFALSDE
jgi:Cof subfamily protein (haloacid dehalogenase superfamily)